MVFIPDEQEKTVKIPIQVRGGRNSVLLRWPSAGLGGRHHRLLRRRLHCGRFLRFIK
jgi:hypothetical protein